MQIAKDCFVILAQRVADSEGRVVDDGTEPIHYVHGGYGGIFPRLEAALEGKAAGDGIQVTLAPEDGFGMPDPMLTTTMTLDHFATAPDLGEQIERVAGDGTLRYRVTAVDGGTVTLDANHPFAGMTLVFSARVVEVRPATPHEVAEQVSGVRTLVAEGMAAERAYARVRAEAQAEADAVALAEAEAVDLVETVHVPQLGLRFRLIFRSQTHKLCWLAPLFLLPAMAGWLGYRGWTMACGALTALWLAWVFLAPGIIRMAIDRWGYSFLMFDFSPNLTPTRLERFIVTGGQVVSVLAVLGFTGVALFHLDQLSDLLTLIGVDILIFMALILLLAVVLPFLVIVLTAFRVRPVIDKAARGVAEGEGGRG